MRMTMTMAVLAASLLLTSRGDADKGTSSFEELLKQAEAGEHPGGGDLLSAANEAASSCVCGDEFAKRECMQKAKDAELKLAKLRATLITTSIDVDALELGTFDFKKSRFPVSIKGPVARHAIENAVQGCEQKVVSCEREEDEDFVAGHLSGLGGGAGGDLEPEVLLTTASSNFDNAVVWNGSFSVLDAEKARALKESKGNITGQAIYRIEGFQVANVEDKRLAMKRAALLQELAKTIKKYDAMGGAAKAQARSIAVPRMKCVEQFKPGIRVGAIRVKLVGLRLWFDGDEFSDYLVSDPPSSTSLASRRAAEDEVKKKQEEAEEARRNQEREERLAHPSKKVDGWRNLKFGASASAVKSIYPTLVEIPALPAGMPPARPGVKFYKAASTESPALGLYLCFYRDALYYIIESLNSRVFEMQRNSETVEDFAKSFGKPRQITETKAQGSTPGRFQILWDSGPSTAQLIINTRLVNERGNVTLPASATLHVVDAAIQAQIDGKK